ncbi:hypothetical protein DPMN_095731 [Dreissena polymorpha]|uniref:Uncharacterized protein n=1 Tax=Dreissena polymorpha TaxID=45954 RepID=A0A9D4L8G7_DREPO|nr:hypothetical protein DPMN_095731 [Dreissena polymorpha]
MPAAPLPSDLFMHFLQDGIVSPSPREQLIVMFLFINVLKAWIPHPHKVVEHQTALCDQDDTFRNNAQCTK